MKKTRFMFFAILFFILIYQVQSYSQITLQVGGGLGYVLPSGDYGGSTTDFYSGTKYGMESGFNVHAKARAGFVFLTAFSEIGYTSLSGSGEAQPGKGSIDVSHQILTIKIGPEFPISLPMSPITPYVQGFVAYNAISGTVDIQGVSDVPSGSYDIATASRLGLGAGIGALFSLGVLKLDVNIQFHSLNLSGKEYNIENPTSHKRLDNYTSLNDGKDPAFTEGSDEHFIPDDRPMEAFEFKVALMFGL